MSPSPRRLEIPDTLGGERLDRALSLLTGMPRSQAARLVADGNVTVGGAPAHSGSLRLQPGTLIEVVEAQPANEPSPAEPNGVPLEVLHADSDVVVLNKPVGVVTHQGAGHRTGTLADALVERYPEIVDVGEADRPGIVHRLDRGTSGLVVCALSDRAYDSLVEQLARRQVRRIYAAIARGFASSPTGTVEAPIGRDPANRTRMAVRTDGRPARTHYSVIETFDDPTEASLLKCNLETGRTHQIRVHLASIGLPLLGDLTYGVADPFGIGRPLLHAGRLEFAHPADGTPMSFTAPIPDDFAEALRGFGFDPQSLCAV